MLKSYPFLDVAPDLLTQHLKRVSSQSLYCSEAFWGAPVISQTGGLKVKAKEMGFGGQGSNPPSDISWLCDPEQVTCPF